MTVCSVGRLLASVISIALVGFSSTARAAGGQTTLLLPAGGPGVQERALKRVEQSLASATQTLAGVSIDKRPRARSDRSPAECAISASCLAKVGAEPGVKRVVGVRLDQAGADFALTFVLVEVEKGRELARKTYAISHKKLSEEPGLKMKEFLAAPEPAVPVAHEPTPPIALATPRAVPAASSEPGGSEAFSGAVAESTSLTATPEPVTSRDPQLGVHSGVLIPRGNLKVGVLVGADFTIAPWPSNQRLLLNAGFDWVRLSHQGPTFLSPTVYPPSRTDLIQDSNIFTLSVGAKYEFLVFQNARFYGGLAVALSLNRTTFQAFSTTQLQTAVAPGGIAALGARGSWKRLAWTIELGLRELIYNLGEPGKFGETSSSGLVVAAGLALKL